MPIRINGQEYDSTTHVNQVEKPGFVFNTEYQRVNPAIYEPQRTNHFEFQVTGLSNLPKYVGYDYLNDSNGASVSNAEEDIRIAVDKAFIPTFQQSVLSVQRGNSTIKYAGKPSFNSGQIVLNDYIGQNTAETLMSWQNLSYDVETEKMGLASDYKKECFLTEYTPDYQPVRRWILKGCWISNLTYSGLSYSGGDSIMQITATIEYDKAVINNSGLTY